MWYIFFVIGKGLWMIFIRYVFVLVGVVLCGMGVV